MTGFAGPDDGRCQTLITAPSFVRRRISSCSNPISSGVLLYFDEGFIARDNPECNDRIARRSVFNLIGLFLFRKSGAGLPKQPAPDFRGMLGLLEFARSSAGKAPATVLASHLFMQEKACCVIPGHRSAALSPSGGDIAGVRVGTSVETLRAGHVRGQVIVPQIRRRSATGQATPKILETG